MFYIKKTYKDAIIFLQKADKIWYYYVIIIKKRGMHMASMDVYNGLKHDILYLNLKPGDMISELEICKQYGVSRTPARDAIKALVAEGLLEVRPHVGTFISPIDLSKVSDSVFIREVLEQAVLKELCPNFNSYDALNLEVILSQQSALIHAKRTPETSWDFIQLDNKYHEKLFEIAGKTGIWDSICSTNQHYNRFRTLLVKCDLDNIEKLYEQHKLIFSSLLSHDEETLHTIINKHVTSGFKRCSEVMEKYSRYFITK